MRYGPLHFDPSSGHDDISSRRYRGTTINGDNANRSAADQVSGGAAGIDSLAVVEILCVLDDILPFEANESVVRPGGYSSIDDAVKSVSGRVEKQWVKHHGEVGK